jgi:tetratricopeptide (TPR) repeat protein
MHAFTRRYADVFGNLAPGTASPRLVTKNVSEALARVNRSRPAPSQRRAAPIVSPAMMKLTLSATLVLVFAAAPISAQVATAEAYRDIGNTLLGRGQTAEAIASYQDALRLRPDFADARRGLGMAYMKLGRHKDAEREFRRLTAARPRDASAHYDLGCALSARGRNEDALMSYREALRLQPGHAQARIAVVTTLTELGRAGEAIAALQESPGTDEPFSVTLGRRARAAHAVGKHAEAVLFWTQALDTDPGYFDTRAAERVLWDASVAALTKARVPATTSRAP